MFEAAAILATGRPHDRQATAPRSAIVCGLLRVGGRRPAPPGGRLSLARLGTRWPPRRENAWRTNASDAAPSLMCMRPACCCSRPWSGHRRS